MNIVAKIYKSIFGVLMFMRLWIVFVSVRYRRGFNPNSFLDVLQILFYCRIISINVVEIVERPLV